MSVDWNAFDRGVYLINTLGIIYNPKTKKILIGLRQNDPYIPNLSWCFPGGRPRYNESLEEGLHREILVKTGLKVRVQQLIFARTHPEKQEFLSLYYHCEVIGGVEKAGELFSDLKWISPSEAPTYFTTSIHPVILAYLHALHP